jgi:hypothetical protein
MNIVRAAGQAAFCTGTLETTNTSHVECMREGTIG